MKSSAKVALATTMLTLVCGTVVYAATTAPQIFVNSNAVQTNKPLQIIDGSVYVPLRTISDSLGVAVQWDNASKRVYVNSDPNFQSEASAVEYVSEQNLALKWIMAYDERRQQDMLPLISSNFKTDIYKESFPAGSYNANSIVDMRVVARTTDTLTMRIVQRVTAEDDYSVKVEKWNFTFKNGKIKFVNIVPKSTQVLDRYTVVPGATFGK
ncbi:stalk domain-containing protein [Paenibacillus sp. WLX1005]|uniref:stalk domain-containing protein n=1 Tax=Paenibacillus sp. WLX1005 TaxID=3243766 RepID=UPI0039843800